MASLASSSSGSSSSSSFPSRALVNVDSNSSSIYGLESDKVLGDDVKFDNAYEKPNVAVVDSETSANKVFDIDKVSVTQPSEKSIEESSNNISSNVDNKGVSWLSVTIPERIMTIKRVVSKRFLAVGGESLVSPLVEEVSGKDGGGETKMADDKTKMLENSPSNVEKGVVSSPSVLFADKVKTMTRVVSRRFLAVDHESLVSPLVEEVYGKDVAGETKMADDKTLSLQSPVVLPLAKLSIESDEDSGVARIPGVEILENLSAPKDNERAEEVGEEEDKLQLKSVLESEVFDDSSELLNGALGRVENNSIAGSVKGEDPHVAIDAKATHLAESNEVSFSSDSSGQDEVAKYLAEEIQELENVEQVSELYDTDSMDSGHNASVECMSATRTENAVYSIQSKEVVEGSQTEDAETDELSSVIYFPIESDFPEAYQDVNVDAISVANINCETKVGQINKIEISILESKSENAGSIMEQHTDFSSAQIPRSSDENFMEEELCCKSDKIHQLGSLGSDSDHIQVESKNVVACDVVRSKEEEEGSCSEDHVEESTLKEFNTVENNSSVMELVFASDSLSGGESSRDHSKMMDEHFITYLDEDADPIGENEGELLFDYASFKALSDAARGSETDDSIAVTFADDSRNSSHEHSADLSSTISSTELTAQRDHPNLSTSKSFDSQKNISEEENKKLDVQHIKVKFLRLVQMLGLLAEEAIASQVLNQLDLAVEKTSNDQKASIVDFEADFKKDLDFSLNILVIGKSGVGKSATINSIFGEEKTIVDPFKPATTAVKEIAGTIDGIKVRVLDTPGLRSSLKDQSLNRKILKSIRRFTKTCPPDVVIYVDRLDMQNRDLNDLPLLKSITSLLGSSLWQKSLIILTHATSITPDGPSGEPLSYETFVALQSHVIRQLIIHATGDQNMVSVGLTIPVCLVENHGLCKKSIDGQALLPYGKSWKPQLLLLCHSVKILSELNSTMKAYITLDDNKLFDIPVPSPPLPYLSSMLQSHDHPKFSVDQCVENWETCIEMGSLSCSRQEDEDYYNQLPSFKPLMKSKIANLSKEQRKAVIEEFEYHIKKKKQWREEVKRLQTTNNAHENPNYWCRFTEDPTSHLLAVPLLDTLAAANPFQSEIIAQIKKEGEKLDVYVESVLSAKNSEDGSTIAGLNIKTIGNHHAWICKGETNMNEFRRNKTAFEASITCSNEKVVSGIKLIDEVPFGKRLVFAGSLGAIQSQDNAAHGANFEVHFRGNEYAVEQEDQTTMNVSLMRWRGDLIWGCDVQSKYTLEQNTKMAIRAGINNKKSGQVSVKVSGSEQLQIALVGLLPIVCNIFSRVFRRRDKTDC